MFEDYSFYASIIVTGLVAVPVLIWAFAQRITLHVTINYTDKSIKVEYLGRFAFTKTTKVVPLARTQIQTTQNEAARKFSIDTHPNYYSVYLINEEFGELLISGQDFLDIRGIVETFTEMRTSASRRLRRRRALSR